MSYERLKMDGWIKSYHRSTVFVCLTGNCIPNRFFTGIPGIQRKQRTGGLYVTFIQNIQKIIISWFFCPVNVKSN
jgi:hypothetical protein